jgi:hypothetical protein
VAYGVISASARVASWQRHRGGISGAGAWHRWRQAAKTQHKRQHGEISGGSHVAASINVAWRPWRNGGNRIGDIGKAIISMAMKWQ